MGDTPTVPNDLNDPNPIVTNIGRTDVQGPPARPADSPEAAESDEAGLWRRTAERAAVRRASESGLRDTVSDFHVLAWQLYNGQWYAYTVARARAEQGLRGSLSYGEAREYGEQMARDTSRFPNIYLTKHELDEDGNVIDAGSISGSGGSGGSGFSSQQGPTYKAPDRASVEDQVKAYVVATTGKAHQNVIDAGVDALLGADQANFGNDTQSTDPWTAMKTVVRGTDEYAFTNEGRPDSVDEMEWTSSRQARLRQLGVSADQAEDLGIAQARVGGTDDDLIKATQANQISTQGTLHETQRNALKRSIASVAGMVK